MDIVQAFVKLNSLVDNNANSISPLGELSDYASTFTKDKPTYSSITDAPGIELVVFRSESNGVRTDLNTKSQNIALKLSQFLFTRFSTGVMGDNLEEIRKTILAEFNADISECRVSDMVTYLQKSFPGRITYNTKATNNVADSEVTLWFSDALFRKQYASYIFEIIPPLNDLDVFFQDPAVVRTALADNDSAKRIGLINKASGSYPHSLVRVVPFTYVDPKDSTFTLNTEWYVVMWGEGGNNPDTYSRAIKDYILANSKRKEEEWKTILPDVFRNNEMVIVPLWNKYAIPNKELQGGIYSPVVYSVSDIETVIKVMPETRYDRSWLNANLQYFHANYKSLTIAAIGHPDSRDSAFKFTDTYGDYISVTNTSPDFNRMSPKTREFTRTLETMLKIAEVTTDKTDSHTDYPRVIRNGVTYISTVIDNKTYLVVCKGSLPNSGL